MITSRTEIKLTTLKDRKIRILIVDDHFTARIGLRVPLAAEPDLTVIAEAQNAAEALEFYRRDRPDMVIMDYKLPDSTGVAAIAKIREEFSEARVLMLTVFDGEEVIHRAVSAGALGYLTKSAGLSELLLAVRTVAQGLTYFPPEVAARLGARAQRGSLILKRKMGVVNQRHFS